jgi:hypothetical protein
VYVISVMAFMDINDALELSLLTGAESDVTFYIEHLPAIVPAFSMKEAAEDAKKLLWKDGKRLWIGMDIRRQ